MTSQLIGASAAALPTITSSLYNSATRVFSGGVGGVSALGGLTVIVFQGNVPVGSAITASDGSFSTTLTGVTTGTVLVANVLPSMPANISAVVLANPLLPATASFPVGSAAGTVLWTPSNKTAGSTITFSPTNSGDAGKIAVDGSGRLIVGLTASSISIIAGTLTETPGTAGNAPVSSPLTITVASAFIPTLMQKAGDSRIQYGGGYTNSGTTSTAGSDSATLSGGGLSGTGGAGMGALEALVGQLILPKGRSNYGVGNTTTRNLTKRVSVQSNAATGNTATTDTGVSADAAFNLASSGEYAPTADPANIVFMLDGVNDGASGSYYNSSNVGSVSMSEIAGIVDTYGAAGKFVLLSNGIPTGRGTTVDEYHAVSSLTFTVATPGTSTPAVDQLINVDTGARYTQVTTLSATGQFAISSAGVVTFFTGDTISRAQISYDYFPTPRTDIAKNKAIAEYLLSSAGNFTSTAGTNYGIPGFQTTARAAYCKVIDSYNDFYDGTTSTNKHDTLVDGLHPTLGGNVRMAALLKTAVNAVFPSQTAQDKRPTTNNQLLGTSQTTQTRFPTSGNYQALGTMVPLVPGKVKVYIGSTVLTETNNGDGTFALTGTNITGSGSYAAGTLTFTASTAPGNNLKIQLCTDGGANLLDNGLLDPAQTGGTLATNVTGAIPSGWTLSVDTDMATALSGGTMTMAVSSGTDSVSGLPKLSITFDGIMAGTPGVSPSILTLVPTLSNFTNRVGATDKLRFGMVANVKPASSGALSGHVAGICPLQHSFQVNSSANYNRPGVATANTTVLDSGSVVSMSMGPVLDDIVPAGGLRIPMLTPELDMTGVVTSATTIKITANIRKGVRVAGVFELSQVALQAF